MGSGRTRLAAVAHDAVRKRVGPPATWERPESSRLTIIAHLRCDRQAKPCLQGHGAGPRAAFARLPAVFGERTMVPLVVPPAPPTGCPRRRGTRAGDGVVPPSALAPLAASSSTTGSCAAARVGDGLARPE